MTQACKRKLSEFLDGDTLRLFRALGDPNRIALVLAMVDGGGPMSVSEAAACCPVDMSVVSRHLATLRDAGLLTAEKRGKEVFYRLRASAWAQRLRALADALDACCPADPAATA